MVKGKAIYAALRYSLTLKVSGIKKIVKVQD
jgi:hypothetical protein